MLIISDQPMAFDKVDHHFLEAVLYMAGIQAKLLLLNSSLLCVPWSYDGGKQDTIKAFHFVSINLSRLSTVASTLRLCVRIIPLQAVCESSPTQNHTT